MSAEKDYVINDVDQLSDEDLFRTYCLMIPGIVDALGERTPGIGCLEPGCYTHCFNGNGN